jgi:predicted amidophosphoribosyltransferase
MPRSPANAASGNPACPLKNSLGSQPLDYALPASHSPVHPTPGSHSPASRTPPPAPASRTRGDAPIAACGAVLLTGSREYPTTSSTGEQFADLVPQIGLGAPTHAGGPRATVEGMTSLPALSPAAAQAAATLARSLADGARDLLGLALPVSCAGCRLPDAVLCAACLALLTTGARHAALRAWPDGPGVWAATAYRGVPARLVVAWKDRGRHDLTGPLGLALGRVRSSRAARRRPAREPGRHCWSRFRPPPATDGAAARTSCATSPSPPCDVRQAAAGRAPRRESIPALRHVRRVRDQSELGAEERRHNLHEALAVRSRWAPALAGRAVVLVDDIVTTGATLAEAGRAVTAAGALPVGACCLCVTIHQRGVFVAASLV